MPNCIAGKRYRIQVIHCLLRKKIPECHAEFLDGGAHIRRPQVLVQGFYVPEGQYAASDAVSLYKLLNSISIRMKHEKPDYGALQPDAVHEGETWVEEQTQELPFILPIFGPFGLLFSSSSGSPVLTVGLANHLYLPLFAKIALTGTWECLWVHGLALVSLSSDNVRLLVLGR